MVGELRGDTPAPHLGMGVYWVDLTCPECDDVVTVSVALVSVLTAPSDDGATLRLKAKSAKMPHLCRQLRLFTAAEGGHPPYPLGVTE